MIVFFDDCSFVFQQKIVHSQHENTIVFCYTVLGHVANIRLKKKGRAYDEENVIEEMLEPEKRDEMPESGGMHHHCYLVIYSKNTMLDI